jgi:hypothetical protein
VGLTATFRAEYARTSFCEADRTLSADVAVRNVGLYPAGVPLLVGVANVSDPAVRVYSTRPVRCRTARRTTTSPAASPAGRRSSPRTPRPASGSDAKSRLAAPCRTYSLFSLAGDLGRTGSGGRASPMSCFPPSSTHTAGRASAGSRWDTASTSSIAATNAALALGGITHCCFGHGLRSCF